tara:strand:+ start:1413 stop:1607 length:195 start_codon:yes stop_codon:yes gene_type:complete
MEQEIKKGMFSKLKSFAIQSKRVLKITKKPSKEEFKVIVKVSGIGIAIIGAIGFAIHLGWKLLN